MAEGQVAQRFDVAVLGGGPGGYVAAIRAAQLGLKVALVEKDRVGGVCLNRGCIPTKSMVKSAELYALLKRGGAASFGVETDGVRLRFEQVMARKEAASRTLVAGLEQLLRANGVQVMPGEGHVGADGRLEVRQADGAAAMPLEAGAVVLATGSLPARPPIDGLDLEGVVDSDGMLALTRLPESLAVIGGGIIGCEFASIFAALGTRVTVLEMLPALLPVADGEVSRRLASSFRKAGIGVVTGARVEAVEATDQSGPFGPLKRVRYRAGESPEAHEVTVQLVLVAVGRRPAYTGFDPGVLGIEVGPGGIKVDAYMRTSRSGFYAVGDVNGISPLAHAAFAQGIIAAEHVAGRSDHPWGASPVPACVFTYPEVAWAGLSEEEAAKAGVAVRVGRFSYTALARAQVEQETDGMVKILARAEPPDEGQIVGVHLIGKGATELVHEGVVALRLGATGEELASAIHAHPTLSEAVGEAAHGLLGSPIHMLVRRA